MDEAFEAVGLLTSNDKSDNYSNADADVDGGGGGTGKEEGSSSWLGRVRYSELSQGEQYL